MNRTGAKVTGIVGSLLLHAAVVGALAGLARMDSAPLDTNEPVPLESINISLSAFSKKPSQPQAIPAPVAAPETEPAINHEPAINNQPAIDHGSAMNHEPGINHGPGKPPVKSIESPTSNPTIKPDAKPETVIAKTALPVAEPLSSRDQQPEKKPTEEVTVEEIAAETRYEQITTITSAAPQQVTTVTASSAAAAEPAVQNNENSNDSAQEADYAQSVRLAVLSQRTYPQRARRKKLTGTVVVTFRIFADGALDFITVSQSSGHKILDRAALSAVHNVTKFKPFPDEISRQFWDFEVPVVFQ